MKSIQDLAREAGAAQDEGLTYFEASELQRFHELAIAQYREGLLEGSGEPVAEVSALYGGAKYQLLPTQDYYTADQLAAAVLRATLAERERDEYQRAADDLAAEAKALRDAAIRGQQ